MTLLKTYNSFTSLVQKKKEICAAVTIIRKIKYVVQGVVNLISPGPISPEMLELRR
jgi:hypothetical protein